MRFIFLTSLLIYSKLCFSQFSFIQTPLTDSVKFIHSKSSNIIVADNKEAFISLNAGNTFYKIQSYYNTFDSLIFKRTKIMSVFVDENGFWLSGSDTLLNKGVIFFSVSDNAWRCIHTSEKTPVFYKSDDIGLTFFGKNISLKITNPFSGTISENIINVYDKEADYFLNDNVNEYVGSYNFYHKNSIPNISYKLNKKIKSFEFKFSSSQFIGVTDDKAYISMTDFNNLKPFTAIKDSLHYNYFKSNVFGTNNGLYKLVQYKYAEKIIGTDSMSFLCQTYSTYFLNSVTYSNYYFGSINGKIIVRYNTSSLQNQSSFPLVAFEKVNSICQNTQKSILNLGNRNNTYKWYLDGNQIASSVDLTDYTFSTLGQHTLKLVGTDGVYSDSMEQKFFVINSPSIISNVNKSSSKVCENESVSFSFQSEINVNYALFRNSNYEADTVFIGDGNVLTIKSIPLQETSTFTLVTGYSINDCSSSYFIDTIFVEKIKADFHVSLINGYLGEKINLFNLSKYENNVHWQSENSVSFIENNKYSTVFNTSGYHDIFLKVSTPYGCVDSILKKNAIFIIDTSLIFDNCFLLNSKGVAGASIITDDQDNFYLFGENRSSISSYNTKWSNIFKSTYGASFNDSLCGGFYVSKYDQFGILRWLIFCKRDFTSEEHYEQKANPAFYFKNNKIYFEVNLGAYYEDITNIHFNDGEIYDLKKLNLNWSKSVIFTIDLDGGKEALLHTTGSNYLCKWLVDENGDFYIMNNYTSNFSYVYYTKNGTFTNSVAGQFIKIDAMGNEKWSLQNPKNSTNYCTQQFYEKNGIIIYIQSMIYIDGNKLYSTDGNVINLQLFSGGNNLIVCYDTSGVYLWHKILSDDNKPYKIGIDDLQNIYLSSTQQFDNFQVSYLDPISNQFVNVQRTLLSFDKNGNYRFSRAMYDANNQFYYPSVSDVYVKNNIIYLSFYNVPIQTQNYLMQNENDKLTLPTKDNTNCTFLVAYDIGGNLINYESYFHHNIYDIRQSDRIMPSLFTISNKGKPYFTNRNLQYYIKDSIYYFAPPGGEYLFTNFIPENCKPKKLYLEPASSICKVDTIYLNAYSFYEPIVFDPSNKFIVEYSTDLSFQSNVLRDTLNENQSLTNLEWQHDFSSLTNSQIYVRLKSTSPEVFSNINKLNMASNFYQDSLSYTHKNCLDSMVNLFSSTLSNNYNWFDEANQLISTNDSISVATSNNEKTYTLKLENTCNESWSEIHKIESYKNTSDNQSSYMMCQNDFLHVNLNSNFNYTLNSYALQINNSKYVFSFSEDTTIIYSLKDSFGCTYSDTLNFVINNIDSLNLSIQTDPNLIYTSDQFEHYNWTSNNNFNQISNTSIEPLENGWYYLSVTDSNNCTLTKSIYFIVDSSLVVSELNNFVFTIMNPIINNQLHLTSNIEDLKYIQLKDFSGKLIHISNDFKFELNENISFLNGVYLLEVYDSRSKERLYVFKIIKV
jgi:hypothetical protein